MIYKLKYGSKEIRFKMKSGKLLGVLKEKNFKATVSQVRIIADALGNKIEKFINKNDRIGVVVPDNTRVAGVKIFLPIILKRLKAVGVPVKKIMILIATGSHKPLGSKEIEKLIGNGIRNKYRVICNNAYEERGFYFTGKTRRGTRIFINRELKNIDKLIATSSVLYHYFAGYGGGPKILMPGLAGFESIASNHKLTLTRNGGFNNKCRNGNIDNNPVYSDIVDSVKFFPPVLYLGTVVNVTGKIIEAFCGNIIPEHNRAARFIDSLYKIRIKRKADVVICSAGGYPKDINLIQAHKSIHNAYSAVQKGGTIICFTECREGIGSKTFLDFFRHKNIKELKKNILRDYSLNAQTALSFWEKLMKVRIILVTKLNRDKITPLLKKGLVVRSSLQLSSFHHNHRRITYYLIPSANTLLIQHK